MLEFYADGQVRRIFPYCKDVDWFILGGPADGNEAQVFNVEFPNVQILGIEPNPVMHKFQVDNLFPGILLNKALWSINVTKELVIPGANHRCGSVVNYGKSQGESVTVDCVTLDKLSKNYGPFENCAVWIDIEGAELNCIKGALNLLRKQKIKVLNIEVNSDTRQDIVLSIGQFGYKVMEEHDVRHMGNGRDISDLIFTL